jgi:two-component system, NtrC family, sensor histidine kinase KinB
MEIPLYNSVRFRISLGFIILVSISVLITIWAIINFNRLGSSVDKIIRENYLSVVAAENMVRSLEVEDNALVALLSDQKYKNVDVYKQTKLDFFQWLQKTQERASRPIQHQILDTIQIQHRRYEELADTLIMFIFDPQLNQIAKTYQFGTIRPMNELLKKNCFRLIEMNQQEMFDLDKRAREISSEATYAVLVASLIAVALAIFASAQFTKSLVEPAERLTETVRNIGRGRLDLKIDVLTNDEFGELSREFNKMTERLRKFEELNIEKILEEKQKSETLVQNISDAIIVCDKQNRVILINDAARKLFNVKKENVEGLDFSEIILDEKIKNIFQHPKSTPYSQQPYLLLKTDGRDVYVRPKVSEIPLPGGETLGNVLILQDVTQFRDLDRMKSEFMATVSHEFRTPLTSINMSVDILNQEIVGKLNKEQKDLIQSTKQDAERLTKLVRELLELSKLESGKFQIRHELISVNEIISDTVKPILLPFKEKSVELKMNLSEKLPKIMADHQQLGWVISNLVNNALRYSYKDGLVRISTELSGNNIVVKVIDNGKGISKENIGKIFDKFVQVKESMETTPGSVGLGLAIAKEIVEAYGGNISVESEINSGSIFTFTIPVESEKVELS